MAVFLNSNSTLDVISFFSILVRIKQNFDFFFFFRNSHCIFSWCYGYLRFLKIEKGISINAVEHSKPYNSQNEICSHARLLVNFVQETVINKGPYLKDSCRN